MMPRTLAAQFARLIICLDIPSAGIHIAINSPTHAVPAAMSHRENPVHAPLIRPFFILKVSIITKYRRGNPDRIMP